MVRLIDDLLDVSRIACGKLELRKRPTNIADAVRNALETSKALLVAAHHDVSVDLPDAPLLVDGDLVRLSQVFANLLNNAARYTPNGGHIAIAARAELGMIEVTIRDDGLGIAAEMLQRVFEPFLQIEHKESRAHGGLGLGLALARSVIELHGGTISAESDGRGRGSRFTVRLPAAAGANIASEMSQESVSATAPLRVLVVDDNTDAAESLHMLLEAMGHAARIANDGIAALDMFAADKPDLVILDIGMPGMDGYEVARRLRARPDCSDVRIVALSGYAQEADRRNSAQAGFDAHLVKPVDLATLAALLANSSRA
jgi:CheY-like chemotaxis protein